MAGIHHQAAADMVGVVAEPVVVGTAGLVGIGVMAVYPGDAGGHEGLSSQDGRLGDQSDRRSSAGHAASDWLVLSPAQRAF